MISLENLFGAWKEFKRGKTSKLEVQEFAFNLENNIFKLHQDLKNNIWKPDSYISFYVRDPKLRHIHKATVRDRVFNQALFRVLYQIFDKIFIFDSYSCREEKGTHRGVLKLKSYICRATQNNTKTVFALKCDVRKFFDNIDHRILFGLIKKKITDSNTLLVIKLILDSFKTQAGKGLPLGNVTSQLFANIYLNELDQFVKHTLKAKYYLRYCDDFIILDRSKNVLNTYIKQIDTFLNDKLFLKLHPNKISIRKCSQGIDFLGYVLLTNHIVLRTKTKKRIFRKVKFLKNQLDKNIISKSKFDQILQSYFGILTHCSGHKIRQNIIKLA